MVKFLKAMSRPTAPLRIKLLEANANLFAINFLINTNGDALNILTLYGAF